MPPSPPPVAPCGTSSPKCIPSSPSSPSSLSPLPLPAHVQTYKSNEPTATLDFSPSKTLQHESNLQSWKTISSWLDTFRFQDQHQQQHQAQHQSQSRNQSEPQTQLYPQPYHTALPASESTDTGPRTDGNKTRNHSNLPYNTAGIERNESTLSALQQLMRTNLSTNANHKRLNDAVVKQIGVYSNHDAGQRRRRDHAQDQDQEVLEFLKQNLSEQGKKALEALAETSVLVGIMPSSSLSYTFSSSRSAEQPSTSQTTREDVDGYAYTAEFDSHTDFTTALGKRITDLTHDLLELQRQLSELTMLRKEFEDETGRIERETHLLKEPDGQGEDKQDEDRVYSRQSRDEGGIVESGDGTGRVPLDVLHCQISDFNVSTKQLQLKIREYQDRKAALTSTVEAQTRDEDGEELTIESVQQMESTMQQKRAEVQKLEERLKKYHGLPPDVEASRAEVARATNELESWRRRRETMFAEMGR